MERLTYRTIWGKSYLENGADAVWRKQVAYGVLDKAIQKLAEYEDLEEQGLLLKLPCKVGTIVYEVFQFCGAGAWEFEAHKITLEDLPKIGKTVFLTKAEAEKALAEMG